jgi:hypothetical protein
MARKGHNKTKRTNPKKSFNVNSIPSKPAPPPPKVYRPSLRDAVMADLPTYFFNYHGVVVDLPLDGHEFHFYLEEIQDEAAYREMVVTFFKQQMDSMVIKGFEIMTESASFNEALSYYKVIVS